MATRKKLFTETGWWNCATYYDTTTLKEYIKHGWDIKEDYDSPYTYGELLMDACRRYSNIEAFIELLNSGNNMQIEIEKWKDDFHNEFWTSKEIQNWLAEYTQYFIWFLQNGGKANPNIDEKYQHLVTGEELGLI